MDQGRLPSQGMTLRHELMSDIARHAKVRVLVDGAGDEAGHVGIATGVKRHGEGGREGRGRLDGGKGHLADVGRAVKSKNAVDRVGRDGFPDPDNVGIHRSNVVQIYKQKNQGKYKNITSAYKLIL